MAEPLRNKVKYVRSHYLVLVVPLVLNILPLIEATAEPRPFFHLLNLRAVAHVASVSPEVRVRVFLKLSETVALRPSKDFK